MFVSYVVGELECVAAIAVQLQVQADDPSIAVKRNLQQTLTIQRLAYKFTQPAASTPYRP